MVTMTTAPADADRVRQRAYELWEQAGRPEGHHVDFWLRAEAELAAEQEPGSPAPAGGEGAAGGLEPDVASVAESKGKVGGGGGGRAPRGRNDTASAADTAQPAKEEPGPEAVDEARSGYVQQRRTRKKAEG
jgi:hypothetical protein